jgi:hypothetical protein
LTAAVFSPLPDKNTAPSITNRRPTTSGPAEDQSEQNKAKKAKKTHELPPELLSFSFKVRHLVAFGDEPVKSRGSGTTYGAEHMVRFIDVRR